jgi:hypothetical protein
VLSLLKLGLLRKKVRDVVKSRCIKPKEIC